MSAVFFFAGLKSGRTKGDGWWIMDHTKWRIRRSKLDFRNIVSMYIIFILRLIVWNWQLQIRNLRARGKKDFPWHTGSSNEDGMDRWRMSRTCWWMGTGLGPKAATFNESGRGFILISEWKNSRKNWSHTWGFPHGLTNPKLINSGTQLCIVWPCTSSCTPT